MQGNALQSSYCTGNLLSPS